jgi:hypothetical protein
VSKSASTPRRVHALEARLKPAQLELLIARYASGESALGLAKELGIANSAFIRVLRARGVQVRKHGVDNETTGRLAHDYAAGATMATLQARYGLSHGAVSRALHRAGVKLRSTGRAPVANDPEHTAWK